MAAKCLTESTVVGVVHRWNNRRGYYGNKDEDETAFKEKGRKAADKYLQLKSSHCVSQTQEQRRMRSVHDEESPIVRVRHLSTLLVGVDRRLVDGEEGNY